MNVDAQREVPSEPNLARGEWKCEVDGEDLIFKMSMEAAIKVQTRTKMTVGELYLAAERTDINAMRELIWAWLQYYHADRFKTLQSVHAVFDYYGGPKPFWDYVSAMSEYLESVKKPQTHGVGGANPPLAQAGSGSDSRSSQASAA